MSEQVFLVDDDPGVLRALTRLIRSAGLQAVPFGAPEEFLATCDTTLRGCLVLDVAMPGLDGLQLQQALTAKGCTLPIIFLTGHGDIPLTVRAMKGGAVDFLAKPVNDQLLLAAVREALSRDAAQNSAHTELAAIRSRLAKLTPRESAVLSHVVAGMLNKQIAADLGTVEQTVKVHRARVMEKMQAPSLADLVRMIERVK